MLRVKEKFNGSARKWIGRNGQNEFKAKPTIKIIQLVSIERKRFNVKPLKRRIVKRIVISWMQRI